MPDIYIESITSQKSDTLDQVFVDLKVTSKGHHRPCIIPFKLDTGAQVSILTPKDYHLLGESELAPTTQRLFSYSGGKLDVIGKCKLQCQHKRMSPQELHFYVVDTKCSSVLSLQACLSLQLIQLVLSVEQQQQLSNIQSIKELLDEYSDVFNGLGLFPGEYYINVDPNVPPVVHAPRRVPFTLKARLKELDKMQQQGVVERLSPNEHCDWVNSLVIVENHIPRSSVFCLYPKDLNKAVKREQYIMPTLDDITVRLAGAKYFSILVARSGYWQIKLDEESSRLTTFNTPFGRYRFTGMPFGINCIECVLYGYII